MSALSTYHPPSLRVNAQRQDPSHHPQPRHPLLHLRPRPHHPRPQPAGVIPSAHPTAHPRPARQSHHRRPQPPTPYPHPASSRRRNPLLTTTAIHQPPSIPLTTHPSPNLKIPVPQHRITLPTPKTPHMMLRPRLILQILPLNAPPTSTTQTPVQLMIMQLTVRPVLMYVER